MPSRLDVTAALVPESKTKTNHSRPKTGRKPEETEWPVIPQT